MEPQLQKMEGPVALLKFSWDLFKNNWKVFVPIAILPSVIGYVGSLFSLSGHNPFFAIITGIASIATGVLSVAMFPALINAIHRILSEPNAVLSVKEQYRVGFSFFWSVVLSGIIFALVELGSVVLLIIPAIIVGVYISFYIYALVLDGKKGFGSLTESFNLVRGRWVPVFGRSLFIGLISMIVSVILSAIVYPFAHDAIVLKVIGGLANLVSAAIITPITVGYSYRMYTNLKSLRQPEVSTKRFKSWLVAFICVGVVSSVVIAVVAIALPIMFGNTLRKEKQEANIRANAEAYMTDAERTIQIQKRIQEAQSNQVPNQ